METLWHYLLLANLYLILFYAFYALLLKRETFFQLNRIYLIAAVVLSFLLPAVQSETVKHWFITEKVQQTIYRVNPLQVLTIKAMPEESFTLGDVLAYLYLAGFIFMLVKLTLQLLELRKLLKQPNADTAYSFFNVIQVDTSLPEQEIITAHEKAHSRQMHSADRLFMELLLIVNWFNPIMYLYRKAIKHLHEFIADQEVINEGTSKNQYAQLLFSQAFDAQAHQLSNTFFNKSLLKQRIMMLQKNKSSRVALVKYGLSAPLFAVMLVLSSATISKSQLITQIKFQANEVLDVPAAEVTGITEHSSLENTEPTTALGTNRTADSLTAVKPQIIQTPVQAAANSVDTVPRGHNEVFTSVDVVPQPQGGIQGFYSYLIQNLRYPAEAKKANVQGRVIVQFIVEKDGSLSDVHALRGPGYGLNEEAVRAIAASPKWKPGTQNNIPVRVQYTVPVQFSMADGKTNTQQSPLKSTKEITVTGYGGSPHASSSDTAGRSKPLTFTGGSNDPLYIIDGKEITDRNALKNINADDIQSIDVIKDKTSTEKYGSKGANGVIIITMKKKQ